MHLLVSYLYYYHKTVISEETIKNILISILINCQHEAINILTFSKTNKFYWH